MNSRILELYETAVSMTKQHHKLNPKLDQEELNYYCANEFAQMILEDCIEICNQVYFNNYPDAEEWERSEEGDAIAESFGVE